MRERVPHWTSDFAFIHESTSLLGEDETIAVRAGETKNRMRGEGRRDFGLIDGIIWETAKAHKARLVTDDPDFRGLSGVVFLGR